MSGRKSVRGGSVIGADTDPASPTFDPSNLMVPQLRNLLLQHGISLPSSARKAALVQAYEDNVRGRSDGASPSAAVRRSTATSGRPSGRGIVLADSPTSSVRVGQATAAGRRLPSASPAFSSRSSRSRSRSVLSGSGQGSASEEEDDASAVSTERDRSVSAQPEGDCDEEKDDSEEDEEEEAQDERETSTFSNRNFFQRRSTSAGSESSDGQSATPPADVGLSTSRGMSSRHSMPAVRGPTVPGRGLVIKGRASMSVVRDDSSDTGTASTLQVARPAAAAVSRRRQSEPHLSPLSEASTASPPPQQRVRRLRQQVKQDFDAVASSRVGATVLRGMAMLTAASVFMWYVWFVHATYDLGYCDTGSASNARVVRYFMPKDADDVALLPAFAQPSCARCPPHARCADGELVACTTADYLVTYPLVSYVPLAKQVLPLSATRASCKADTRKARLAIRVGKEAGQVLRSWRGDVLCGVKPPHPVTRGRAVTGATSPNVRTEELTFALPESRLRAELEEYMRMATRYNIDDGYLDSLWSQALEQLESTGVATRISASTLGSATGAALRLLGAGGPDSSAEGVGDDLLLARGANISMGCRARLALHGAWKAVRLWFALATMLAGAALYARFRFRQARAEKEKIRELVDAALEKLQDHEYAHAVDPVLTPEPFVPTAQLRDHVMRSEHSRVTRQRLWQKVAAVVEENANVRTRQAKSRGEWVRVWEWIGVSAGTPSLSRIQSSNDLAASSRKGSMLDLAAAASPLSRLGRSLLGAASGSSADLVGDTSGSRSPVKERVGVASPSPPPDASRKYY